MDEAVEGSYDFTFVDAIARIAQYDDLMSAPRITEIQPAETGAFIEELASTIYQQAQASGGTIPYTVIREVSENFIHAQFAEMVVTILDHGNTIRFADQGPGIPNKENAQLPGFSSAREPMKKYIRGVGSGLPIVKEYLEFSHGTITIEDNLGRGSVVTLSVDPTAAAQAAAEAFPGQQQAPYGQPQQFQPVYGQQGQPAYAQQGVAHAFGQVPMQQQMQPQGMAYGQQAAQNPYFAPEGQNPQMMGAMPQNGSYAPAMAAQNGYTPAMAAQNNAMAALSGLSDRERLYLQVFADQNSPLGVTDLSNLAGDGNSTVYNTLKKLEEAGLVTTLANKKRSLTTYGQQIAASL
ncbi:MAG: ATP-binding protein [Coriobacteriia bacterium]|nr:ATP-binding protein [Coriobacteriia bacterium]